MQKLKSQAISVLALVVLCVLGYYAAITISGLVNVRVKKIELAPDQLRIPSKINWVSAHQASITALDESKPIVCFFTTPAESRACRSLEQEFFGDSTVAEFVNKNFVPVIVIDNASLPETAPERIVIRNYGVSELPTLLITDPDGKVIDQKLGYSSLTEVFKFLQDNSKPHHIDKYSPIRPSN